jgi:hypothetical protein
MHVAYILLLHLMPFCQAYGMNGSNGVWWQPFSFSLGVLLVPILLGLFVSLRIEFGLTQARQTFYRLLKIVSFLAPGWFGLVLICIVLHMLLI